MNWVMVSHYHVYNVWYIYEMCDCIFVAIVSLHFHVDAMFVILRDTAGEYLWWWRSLDLWRNACFPYRYNNWVLQYYDRDMLRDSISTASFPSLCFRTVRVKLGRDKASHPHWFGTRISCSCYCKMHWTRCETCHPGVAITWSSAHFWFFWKDRGINRIILPILW